MKYLLLCLAMITATMASAQGPSDPMTMARLAEIVKVVDPDARATDRSIELTVDDVPVIIVADPAANRMRAMVPIRSAEEMTADELRRVMQANFDTALDARYAVANGRLWAVFIHPLAELQKDQFLSALGQTINIATTYGSLYSGGAMQFGAGDSGGLQRQLIDRLLEQGEEI